MARYCLVALGICVLLTGPTLAGAAPSLHLDVPAAYTPGTPFDVTIVLFDAHNFASFYVDLSLTGDTGTPGTDFFFAGAAEPANRYVFGIAGDGFAFGIPPGEEYRIGVSDLLISGTVNTVAGVNDFVGVVTVNTLASQTGNLTVSFVVGELELDDDLGNPIPGYDSLVENLSDAVVVPEPVSISLLLVSFAGLLLRRRR